jgi:hypothetical protein
MTPEPPDESRPRIDTALRVPVYILLLALTLLGLLAFPTLLWLL